MSWGSNLGRTGRACLVAFIIPSLWLAVVDGPLAALPSAGELGVRALFGLIAVTLVVLLVASFSQAALQDEGTKPPTPDNPPTPDELDEEIERSIAEAVRKYSGTKSLEFFAKMLLDTRLLVRTYEQAEILDQSLLLRTSIDYSLDEQIAEGAVIAVPVIEAPKGRLLDSFEVVDATGAVVPTLPQNEGRGLIAHAIITLYAKAYGASLEELLSASKRPEPLKQLLRMVYLRGRFTRAQCEAEYAQAINGLRPLDNRSAKYFCNRLKQLCTYYAKHYLVAVDVALPERSTRVHLQYRQIVPITGLVKSRRQHLRTRLGLYPYKFIIAMPLIYKAASYHFFMRGVAGQYVQNHEVFDLTKDTRIQARDIGDRFDGGYLRLRYKTGLPFARAYARGFNRLPQDRQVPLASVIEFAEVPPGALGGATRVVSVTAILVTLFAFLTPAATDVSSDAAALLLAAPAAFAAWVGHSLERLRQSSLATYFGLIVAQVVSLAAAILYLGERGLPEWTDKHLTVHDQRILGFLELPDFDIAWLALSLLAIFVAGYLSVLGLQRSRSYLKAVERWNDPI